MKKFISWNVNGIRAVMNKDFMTAFNSLDADIFCLQETKVQSGQIDFAPEGYHCYWNYAEKKGYSGTAIFSKDEPIGVEYGIKQPFYDNEGRVITLEFEKFYFITCYTPNSQDGLKRLEYRMSWEDKFREYVLELEKKKPVVFCYPVLVLIVFLLLGFAKSLWHPAWILFLTIPIFYIIAAKAGKHKHNGN